MINNISKIWWDSFQIPKVFPEPGEDINKKTELEKAAAEKRARLDRQLKALSIRLGPARAATDAAYDPRTKALKAKIHIGILNDIINTEEELHALQMEAA